MKKLKRVIAYILISCLFLSPTSIIWADDLDQPVEFKDKVLEAKLLELLRTEDKQAIYEDSKFYSYDNTEVGRGQDWARRTNITKGEDKIWLYSKPTEIKAPDDNTITKKELENIRAIRLIGKGDEKKITSLDGLEFATKLWSLNITNNSVEDLTPITGLPSFYRFYADKNELKFIPKFKSLTEFYANDNKIKDISALVDNNIQFAYLENNELESISGLSNSTNLQRLYLANNDIKSIEALDGKRLYHLALNNNSNIDDFSPLYNAFKNPNSKIENVELINLKLDNQKLNLADFITKNNLKELGVLQFSKNNYKTLPDIYEALPTQKENPSEKIELAFFKIDENNIKDLSRIAQVKFASKAVKDTTKQVVTLNLDNELDDNHSFTFVDGEGNKYKFTFSRTEEYGFYDKFTIKKNDQDVSSKFSLVDNKIILGSGGKDGFEVLDSDSSEYLWNITIVQTKPKEPTSEVVPFIPPTPAPDDETPDDETPEEETPDKPNPDKEDPDKSDPDKEDPDKSDPDKENPDKPDSENPVKETPDQDSSEEETPKTPERPINPIVINIPERIQPIEPQEIPQGVPVYRRNPVNPVEIIEIDPNDIPQGLVPTKQKLDNGEEVIIYEEKVALAGNQKEKTLPKTSGIPFLGFLGVGFMLFGLGITLKKRK